MKILCVHPNPPIKQSTIVFGVAQPSISEAGAYHVVVTNESGMVASLPVQLTVTALQLAPAPPTPGSVGFTFPTIEGRRYIIERKFRLEDPLWSIVEVRAGTGAQMLFTRPTTSESAFFRVRVE